MNTTLNVRAMANDSLTFIRDDCYEAIRAMPDNPKAMQYMVDMLACKNELERRFDITLTRKAAKNHAPHDRLLVPIRHRKRVVCSEYNNRMFYSSLFTLAWNRLHKGGHNG